MADTDDDISETFSEHDSDSSEEFEGSSSSSSEVSTVLYCIVTGGWLYLRVNNNNWLYYYWSYYCIKHVTLILLKYSCDIWAKSRNDFDRSQYVARFCTIYSTSMYIFMIKFQSEVQSSNDSQANSPKRFQAPPSITTEGSALASYVPLACYTVGGRDMPLARRIELYKERNKFQGFDDGDVEQAEANNIGATEYNPGLVDVLQPMHAGNINWIIFCSLLFRCIYSFKLYCA